MKQPCDVAGIRARHVNARINPAENPAWFHTHRDLEWLIEEYDRTLAERNAARNECVECIRQMNRLQQELDSDRAAKERLALELARADEERERKASQIGSLEDALSFESAKAARLQKELEEARKPQGGHGLIQRYTFAPWVFGDCAYDGPDTALEKATSGPFGDDLCKWRDVQPLLARNTLNAEKLATDIVRAICEMPYAHIVEKYPDMLCCDVKDLRRCVDVILEAALEQLSNEGEAG